MIALDLFCGVGGASMGLYQAGFDEIVGVDIKHQPNYPFQFVRSDFTHPDLDLSEFDFIWASPPCQKFSRGAGLARNQGKFYPDLVGLTRAILDLVGKPYVIENVPAAPIRHDLILTGKTFGLRVERRRYFELGFGTCPQPTLYSHPPRATYTGEAIPVYRGTGYNKRTGERQPNPSLDEMKEAMDMPWVERKSEIYEAIPPAYSRYIAENFKGDGNCLSE